MMVLVGMLVWLDGRLDAEMQVAKARVERLPRASSCDPLL
jgi:hypothetical protein